MFQLSHPFMSTGKTIVLTIQTFVGKVMSLLLIHCLGLSLLGTHFYINLCLPTQIVVFHWDALLLSTRTTYILKLALGLHSPREPVSGLTAPSCHFDGVFSGRLRSLPAFVTSWLLLKMPLSPSKIK